MTIRAYTLGDIINDTLRRDALGYKPGEIQKMYPPLDPPKPADIVNNPPHYTEGGIETIDYMKAKASTEEFHGHLRLTAIKYLSRGPYKNNALEDYKKAQWYLSRLIKELESLQNTTGTGSMESR